MVDREVQRTLGHREALELIGELPQDRAAEWQVAQVILERGKASDCLAAHAEGGNTVRDHLFSVRDDLEDGAAKCLKRVALRLIETPQVLVNFLGGHWPAVYERRPGEFCLAASTSISLTPQRHPQSAERRTLPPPQFARSDTGFRLDTFRSALKEQIEEVRSG